MNKKQYIEKYGQAAYDKKLAMYKEYYKNNREQVLAMRKDWYKQNREQVLAICKEYYKNNRKQILANCKDYYDSNRRGDSHGFCCDPLDQIENYELAAKDNFIGWDLHHKLEIRDGYINTVKDLKLMNLYFQRPACELIYLKHNEHARIHRQTEKLLSK